MVNIGKAILKPEEAIKEIKERKLGGSILLLLIAAIVTTISAVIWVASLNLRFPYFQNNFGNMLAIGAVGAFIGVFVGGLLGGLYLQLVMRALGAKSDYFAGLSVVSYTAVPLSIACVIASVLTFVPKGIGGVITLIIATVFIALALGTLYNSIKQFFNTDMITAFVGVSVLVATLVLAFYLSAATLLASIGPGGIERIATLRALLPKLSI
ncbi:MAG: YIP1 family protein [Candidatus Thermoplasmatota archaeon]